MFGLVLLLTAFSITLTNGIPIEINSPYLEYPEEYKENHKNHNYFDLPKTSYELRPQLQSNSKRDKKELDPELFEFPNSGSTRRSDSWNPTNNKQTTAGSTKQPSVYDYIDRQGKRSFKSQELYEKLIALGLDYIEASNIIKALHQLQRKMDDKNVQ